MAGRITTNQVQLGDSATASQNFHLQTNVDGTLSLNRGNVGASIETVLSINSNGVVAQKPQSMVRLNTNGVTTAGYGSTNTAIRRFTNIVVDQGSDISYADSATAGASFTINTSGVYAITHCDSYASSGSSGGISLNSTQLSTNINAVAASDCLSLSSNNATNNVCSSSWTGYLAAGSVVRPHGTPSANTGTVSSQFTIVRVA